VTFDPVLLVVIFEKLEIVIFGQPPILGDDVWAGAIQSDLLCECILVTL
jgi:hypothetical protein